MASRDKALTNQLADFLQFLGKARSFLKQNKVSKHHPDVLRVRRNVEEHYHDDQGKPSIYQKYESTLYEDSPAIITLWSFFQTYDRDLLRCYHKLTKTELSGLKGDFHPIAILGRTVLGSAALVMSGLTVWWGLIKLVSANETGNPLIDLLHSLSSSAMVNRLVGIIWIVGMFVVIWYAIRMVRNRRQVAFLSSLSRALELYLDNIDSRGKI